MVPSPLETVSQCHPEAVAEGSRICEGVQSLDSSPAAQNDIRVIFVLRHSLLREKVRIRGETIGTLAFILSRRRLCRNSSRLGK